VSVCGTVQTYRSLREFSWKQGIGSFARLAANSPSRLSIVLPDLPKSTAYTLRPGLPSPGSPSLLRPPFAICSSTGILTCFPLATLFSLTLGADSPCADDRCAGNLGLRADGLFTRLIVTHVSIRSSDTSNEPLSSPSTAYRTLLYRVHISQCAHPTLRSII
jgi:hypothetical protein